MHGLQNGRLTIFKRMTKESLIDQISLEILKNPLTNLERVR